MIKETFIDITMTPKEYIEQLFAENPLIIDDPNYKTVIISSIRAKYYFDISLEDTINNVENMLREMGKLRSEESAPYPSIVKDGHLEYLKGIYQPEQKTQEWYDFRHDHITASNAWKALGTISSRNQLIYEKCQPLNTEKYKSSLVETPMSWGNKYEYLTTCLYEEKNQTTIGTFGCIAHKDYPFLAASPDGIVTGNNNYGRMIEIKNVVSREITGIPKKDYYIQMQLQMEVCDLEECDFVETKFVEYDSEADFNADSVDPSKKKGVILVFINEYNEFNYEYMPLHITDYNEWMEETFAKKEKESNLTWFKNVYWKLDVYSCVLVKRQREWFKAAVPAFISIWDTILSERISGLYQQRAPKKRILKNENKNENKNELKPELLVNVDGLVCDQEEWRQRDTILRENISED
jgi:putative phage-type endonuclease